MQRPPVVLTSLLLAAAAYAAAPLVLPPEEDWLAWRVRGPGFALAALVFLAYGALGRGKGVLTPDARGRRLAPRDVVLLLAFPLYVLFVGNGLVLTSADNTATRALGPLLVTRRTIELSSLPAYQTRRLHYSAVRIGTRILPAFPLGTGLLTVPYTAVALAASGGQVTPELTDRWEKHQAALLTAASAAFLFIAVRRRFGERCALATALVFALGTTAVSCMSQALWSTTGEVFFLTAALALLPAEEASVRRAFAAGLAIGAAFVCRPTALLAAGALGILLWGRGRELLAYGAAAVGSMGTAALALLRLYAHPLGGYGLINAGVWGTRVAEGLAATLLSPSRGLLVFLPYLLFVPLGMPALGSDRELRRTFLAALAGSLATYLLASGYDSWWGGKSVGPRLMTEAAPFLALLVLPIFRRWSELGPARLGFAAALALAVATQLLSAYTTRGEGWNATADFANDPGARWSLRRSQIVALWCPSCMLLRH